MFALRAGVRHDHDTCKAKGLWVPTVCISYLTRKCEVQIAKPDRSNNSDMGHCTAVDGLEKEHAERHVQYCLGSTHLLCTGTNWAPLCFLTCTCLQCTLHLLFHFKPKAMMFSPSVIPNAPFARLLGWPKRVKEGSSNVPSGSS